LPPTPAAVDAFLADSSPDAYEKLVDRLLMSPRYGERMAADWLDAARYADTNGFQVDRDRDISLQGLDAVPPFPPRRDAPSSRPGPATLRASV
jgi:hypothetical protein